jgi:hypothetical protein
MPHKDLHNIQFNFRKGWTIAWIILIIGSLAALVNVSNKTCGEHIPILLSRALTTDPYRGATLVFCLFAAFSSIYLNSILMSVGFFGFFSAFLVSMFQTAASHDALILMSSILILWECYPENNLWWKVHWWFTVATGAICTGWFIYIIYGCEPIEWTQGPPLPDSVRCARCSWWFISEYICFWAMFMLVFWKIDPKLEWHDKIVLDDNRAMPGTGENQETTRLLQLSQDNIKF